MSRRRRHFKKLLNQCGGDVSRLEQILPAATVTGSGLWLGKGSPGGRVTLPMSSERLAKVKKAVK